MPSLTGTEGAAQPQLEIDGQLTHAIVFRAMSINTSRRRLLYRL